MKINLEGIEIRAKTYKPYMVVLKSKKQIEKTKLKALEDCMKYNIYPNENEIVHSILPFKNRMTKAEIEKYKKAVNKILTDYGMIEKNRGSLGSFWQKIKRKGREAVGVRVKVFDVEVEVMDE